MKSAGAAEAPALFGFLGLGAGGDGLSLI